MFNLRYHVSCALVAACVAGGAPDALAHGNMRADQDACVLKVGPDLMYFTGYQPSASRRKFCEDIPLASDTIFVLDYAQDEMRDMTTDFRIVRNVGEEDEAQKLDSITVAYLPPRTYPTGTLNFEHVFKEGGDFVGIVTVDGPHGEHWVSRFPFSVGRIYSPRLPVYLLTAAAVLGLLLLFWGKENETQATRKG